MRYIFSKRTGELKYKDKNEEVELDTELNNGHTYLSLYNKICDSTIDNAEDYNDLETKRQIRVNEILKELSELDIEVPRLLEDMLNHRTFEDFQIHESKQAIIDRKVLLRNELSNL
jgi:hypothetical protein